MSGIHDVARASGLKTELVAAVFETILSTVASGEDVRIKGFGTFRRKMFAGRTLTTPAVNDGKPIQYPDSFVLKFHQSQLAKRRINIVAKKAKGEKKAKPEAPVEPKTKKKKPAAEAPAAPPAEAKPTKPKKSKPPAAPGADQG